MADTTLKGTDEELLRLEANVIDLEHIPAIAPLDLTNANGQF